MRVRSHRLGENEPNGQQKHREAALGALLTLWDGYRAAPALGDAHPSTPAQGAHAPLDAHTRAHAAAAPRAQLSVLRGKLLAHVCAELWAFALAETREGVAACEPRWHGLGSEAGAVAVSALLLLLAHALGNGDDTAPLEPCVREEQRGIAALFAALFVPRNMVE